ncbi:MAG: hypothetical protein CSA72_10435 [Rhodobacterales bacterium]|nr:MAG: hypothetical protein CSA72_10435 [Rhodobacterales bacterium]
MAQHPTARVLAIRRAALRFANNYGPLHAANGGNETAQHEVAHRLFHALQSEGLQIVMKDQPHD